MSARDELDRWQAEAQTNAVLGRTATQENARQMLAAVKALRDVLDEHKPATAYGVAVCKVCSQVKDDDEWDDPNDSPIASWLPFPCPTVRAIEAALGGEGR